MIKLQAPAHYTHVIAKYNRIDRTNIFTQPTNPHYHKGKITEKSEKRKYRTGRKINKKIIQILCTSIKQTNLNDQRPDDQKQQKTTENDDQKQGT